MAVLTSSNVFGPNIVSALNNTIALNLADPAAGTYKYTLWLNTMTAHVPSSDTGNYGTAPWVVGVEAATSGSYTQGGFNLATPGFAVNTAVSGARMLWKDTNAGTSITGFTGTPYGGMARWEAGATDYGIVWHYFGGPVPVTAGTLNITWNSTYASGTLFYIPFA